LPLLSKSRYAAGLQCLKRLYLECYEPQLADAVSPGQEALFAAGSDVGALAHITGGGWEGNVPRTLPPGSGVEIDTGSWHVPPIFTLIQQRGDIADEEMVRTFNVGIGLTVVVPAAAEKVALTALPEACRVGQVVAVADGEPRVRFA
jgi:phosphoribosylaminoimidazole (AIR) synthetase